MKCIAAIVDNQPENSPDVSESVAAPLLVPVSPSEPVPLTEAQIEAALERTIEKIYGEKIEQLMIRTIEKTVTREIARIKNALLEETTTWSDNRATNLNQHATTLHGDYP